MEPDHNGEVKLYLDMGKMNKKLKTLQFCVLFSNIFSFSVEKVADSDSGGDEVPDEA